MYLMKQLNSIEVERNYDSRLWDITSLSSDKTHYSLPCTWWRLTICLLSQWINLTVNWWKAELTPVSMSCSKFFAHLKPCLVCWFDNLKGWQVGLHDVNMVSAWRYRSINPELEWCILMCYRSINNNKQNVYNAPWYAEARALTMSKNDVISFH